MMHHSGCGSTLPPIPIQQTRKQDQEEEAAGPVPMPPTEVHGVGRRLSLRPLRLAPDVRVFVA